MQAPATGQAGAAAGVEHRLRAALHGLQALLAGAVEHAGVGQTVMIASSASSRAFCSP
jgi:hypothetical protein